MRSTQWPDGTQSRVEFSPWLERRFDRNDTVLGSSWHAERANSDAIWAPVPAEPGRPFRRTWARIPEHLGARSDASGHGFRDTWAPVPEHLGARSGAPGQALERVALGGAATA
jgi:hypothetical protein